MRDYELSVLDQYHIEVSGTHKTRGAILCDTDQGLLLFKSSRLSGKRIPMLKRLYAQLEECGYTLIDKPVENAEGEYISKLEDGSSYILKRWFSGRECDVRKEQDVLLGVSNLARLHKIMVFEDAGCDFAGPNLKEEYLRHNRELKKARSFIRGKTPKGEFELAFLKCFDYMYEWAQKTSEWLDCSEYDELFCDSVMKGTVTHGDYNYHNLIMTNQGIATTNFEHFYVDVQIADFYYFFRKVLEKHCWDECLGDKMLHAYNAIRPLSKEELKYMAIRLAYPEKFWKSANTYYHSNKAWIPVKSIEKLRVSIAQTEQKKRFLENIFAFHL